MKWGLREEEDLEGVWGGRSKGGHYQDTLHGILK